MLEEDVSPQPHGSLRSWNTRVVAMETVFPTAVAEHTPSCAVAGVHTWLRRYRDEGPSGLATAAAG